MLRFIALVIIGGHFQWQKFQDRPRDGDDEVTVVFHVGDSVDFATVLSERYKAEALKELEKLLDQNKIGWIHPGERGWLVDLQAFAAAFDSPELKSLNWFQGIVPVEPDCGFQKNAVGNERYQTIVQFHISSALFDADAINRKRLNEAYSIISHLESSLRAVIERKLQEMHGPQWWKRGVPEPVRIDCEQRKSEKEKPGEAGYHPINYAYVDNYKTIVVKRDNWDAVFKAVFGDKAQVEVCFSWVANVRDAIAHARPVNDEDYRMFLAGASWLQSAIDRA